MTSKSEALITALDECLRALEAGAGLEAALARYPDLADELRPLLLAAQAARPAEPLRVPRQSETASRARLLARAQALRRARPAGPWWGQLWGTLRPAALGLTILLAGIFSTAGLVSASAQSVPGDVLYGVKRAAETVQLSLTLNPAARASLEAEFDRRRLSEAEWVAAQGRAVAVMFEGLVEQQAGERWQVAGLRVMAPAGVGAGIGVGARVEVAGVSQPDGSIRAERISLQGAAPIELALPTRTPVMARATLTAPQLATADTEAQPEPGETEVFEAEDHQTPLPASQTPRSVGGGGAPTQTVKPKASTATPAAGSGHGASPTPQTSGGDPVPSNTAKPQIVPSHTPEPRPTETAAPSKTPEPSLTTAPSPTPHSDDTPEATPTADETETPELESVEFEGRVEAEGAVWVIAGQSVTITADTEFRNDPRIGDRVKVHAWKYPNGSLVARRIEKD